jgi:hypothetical protein
MPGDEEESAAQLQAFLDSKPVSESATEETVFGLFKPSATFS